MSRPRLLDLFCGAGGAARGYQAAGFHVTGVDIRPQPRYAGDHFHQADIMAVGLPALLRELGPFDAIHASPPCQAFTAGRHLHGKVHADLLTPTRAALQAQTRPWVIENVPGAPMRPDVVLCGSAFDLGVRRHRWFEASWPLCPLVLTCNHSRPILTITGHGGGSGQTDRWSRWTAAQGREAMGIEWMTRDELTQAIPPAYAEWIGRQLASRLRA